MFFGFVVQMYWGDHAPPHIHVYYQSMEALVRIADGEVYLGELPRGARRLIRDWVSRHRRELMANWERGSRRLPFERVPGADVE